MVIASRPVEEADLRRADRRHATSTTRSSGTARPAIPMDIKVPGEAEVARRIPRGRQVAARGATCAWQGVPAPAITSPTCRVPSMLHARVIRPTRAACTVRERRCEARSRGMHGAQRRAREGFRRGARADASGTRCAPRSGSRSTGTTPGRRVPGDGEALRPHPRGAGDEARGGGEDAATSRRFSRPPRKWWKPNTSGRSSRTPAWGRRARWPTCSADGVHGLDRARRSRTTCSDGVAKLLGLPQDKVHAIWVAGPGSYGRNDAGDARARRGYALEDRPVDRCACRACAWTAPPGTRRRRPACTAARAALDASGKVVGVRIHRRRASRASTSRPTSPIPRDSLVGHGDRSRAQAERRSSACRRSPTASRTSCSPGRRSRRCVADGCSPLRTSHLRDPVGPEIHFGSGAVHRRARARRGRGSGRVPAEVRHRTARRRQS